MGIFTKLLDIMNANLNTLLDKAEDPEKMIRLMIQEMEDFLVDLKSSCAVYIGAKSRICHEQQQLIGNISKWADRAVLAVKNNYDNLAKEALVQKYKSQIELESIKKEYDSIMQVIDEYKNNISLIEEKLIFAYQKCNSFIDDRR